MAYAIHLQGVRCSAKLVGQLIALRKPRRAQRVSFRQQAARRIGYNASTVAIIAIATHKRLRVRKIADASACACATNWRRRGRGLASLCLITQMIAARSSDAVSKGSPMSDKTASLAPYVARAPS